DPKKSVRPINARSETVATRPMFRKLIEMHRCVIPVDGFYEWQVTSAGKPPHYLPLEGREAILLAGLWDRLRPGHQDQTESVTIRTSDASPSMARLHDRMPALIAPADLERWLDTRGTNAATAQALLRPSEAKLAAFPVSRLVNAARNEGPDLIVPVPADGG